MSVVETIPLPDRETSDGEPFHLEVGDLTAWPNQTFAIDFEYNDYRGRWSWEMTHQSSGRSIGGTANLLRINSFWPFMLQQFIPAAEAHDVDQITTDTLGSQVHFAVYPGPSGGDFLPNAGLTQAERDALLDATGDGHWWYNE